MNDDKCCNDKEPSCESDNRVMNEPQRIDQECLAGLSSIYASSNDGGDPRPQHDTDDGSSSDKKIIRPIHIEQLDYGYVGRIGCQTMAISDKDVVIQMVTDYLNNPSRTETRWLAGTYFEKHRKKLPNSFVIGVIAKNQNDFKEYADQFPNKVKGSTSKHFSLKILDENDEFDVLTYYCVTKPDDCRGFSFDRIVETNNARMNGMFEAITTTIQATMLDRKTNINFK